MDTFVSTVTTLPTSFSGILASTTWTQYSGDLYSFAGYYLIKYSSTTKLVSQAATFGSNTESINNIYNDDNSLIII